EITEKTIQFYLENCNKYDYVSNSLKKTYPRGLDTEVFSYEILTKAFYEANDKKYREHVTAYIWGNPNTFALGCYENKIDYSDLRWTLDTNEDLELINKIYQYFYNDKGNNFNMNDIIKLYKKYPQLREINMDIKQKEL
ncbi:acylneuraminate cytidylyltransferase, partial [Clostridium sporogenes]